MRIDSSDTGTALPAPLAGVRVLDLSRIVSGPYCGRLLADLGADVIKLEAPGGDMTRFVPPLRHGVSAYYAQVNAGKRNMCVDLAAAGAAEVVARLAATCDVVIENFRPNVLAKHGLDAATLRAADPRLIYCSVSGWGQQGGWANRRAYAPIVHAEIGTMELDAQKRGRRPEYGVNQHADVYCAILAANAVLAALLQRGATGLGQHLDLALGQAGVYANEWAAASIHPSAGDAFFFDTWNHRVYPLGDGSYVALVGNPADFFPLWVPAFGGDAALLQDPRFATREARVENAGEVDALISDLTRSFADFAAIEALGSQAILLGQVRSVAELANSEWARDRGLFTEVADELPVPAAPWASDGAAIGVRPVVADTGADNDAVLAEVGFDTDTVAALYERGVLLRPQLDAPTIT